MHIKCLLTNYNQWLCSKVHSNYLCSIHFKTIHIRQGDRIERLTKTFILQLHYRGQSKYFGYFHVQHYSYLQILVWHIVISMQWLIMIVLFLVNFSIPENSFTRSEYVTLQLWLIYRAALDLTAQYCSAAYQSAPYRSKRWALFYVSDWTWVTFPLLKSVETV